MSDGVTRRTARTLAAATVFGLGVSLSGLAWVVAADSPPADKKTDTDKAEGKKRSFDPKDVRIGPPPELAALREAVEEAARKGENVDEVRKQLDALEKALAGKAWVKPKPAAEPPPPAAEPDDLPPNIFPQNAFPLPAFPNIRPLQPDLEAIQKAQQLMLKAARLRADDPEKAAELMKQAQEMMNKALRAGGGFGGGGAFVLPLRPADRLALPARGNGRLGVRVERVPDALRDQLDLPAGRGILAAEVMAGSAAEKAGLQDNDVIVEFAGKPVTDDPTEFVRTVQATKGKADLVFIHKGKKQTVKDVPLAEPARKPAANLD